MSEVYSKLITSKNPNLMNYSSRNGIKIDRIVIHHNATTNKNTAMNTWLQSGSAQTSAHYEVTPTEIIGCISESDAAWHCGGTGGSDVPKMANPNQRSIGIENVNATGAPNWSVDHKTVVNCAKLVADICKRYGIPCDRQHVLGHNEVTQTACPGGINVNEVVTLANGGKVTSSKTATKTATGLTAEKGVFVNGDTEIMNRVGSPSTSAAQGGYLPAGGTWAYDGWIKTNGFTWIHHMYAGQHIYLPVRQWNANGTSTPWGTFK
jgi:hypothetical protein